ncbi:hypothetical protein MSBRW_0779 [Methanosarcina barkeri str. Wiesmoor]|uniref:Uncharacterized protein n=1 Tax=Methanosarcina barkeri str. Wiesmoor TaxID=1434109 RepID=A0A0E3QJ68_METBA|nr:hypothetical protein [Methanosarcina barkeri]AKB50032.1 hypothetical protein MSBRW_0779 [Methanosarcina barkeri str. Wiesmoor]
MKKPILLIWYQLNYTIIGNQKILTNYLRKCKADGLEEATIATAEATSHHLLIVVVIRIYKHLHQMTYTTTRIL